MELGKLTISHLDSGYNLIYTNLTDEKLAGLYVKNNDELAFNELVSRFGDKIYRLSLRITKSPHLAEEILQIVFLKLIERLGDFRGSSKLSTWIYTITKNECFNYLRKSNKYSYTHLSKDNNLKNGDQENYEVEGIDTGNNPEEMALNKEQSEFFNNAINKLHEDYRIVYQLRDIEGLSNKQTAEALGISVAAVKSRILRARNELKGRLSKLFPEYQS